MIKILNDLEPDKRAWVLSQLNRSAKPQILHTYSELKSIAEYLRCHSEGWNEEYHQMVLTRELNGEEIELLQDISKRPDDEALADYCKQQNRALRKRVVRLLEPNKNNKKWWQL